MWKNMQKKKKSTQRRKKYAEKVRGKHVQTQICVANNTCTNGTAYSFLRRPSESHRLSSVSCRFLLFSRNQRLQHRSVEVSSCLPILTNLTSEDLTNAFVVNDHGVHVSMGKFSAKQAQCVGDIKYQVSSIFPSSSLSNLSPLFAQLLHCPEVSPFLFP